MTFEQDWPTGDLSEMPTARIPTIMAPPSDPEPQPEPLPDWQATAQVPAVREPPYKWRVVRPYRPRPRGTSRWDTTFIVALALVLAACASWYAYSHHLLLLYGDAYSHLVIARRVFDSATPGVAQLGAVWLPLPHLLLLPFVAVPGLWQSGLAGSLAGGLCYAGAAGFVSGAARRLTGSRLAAWTGALVFLWNANVLYLQSTPLTEPLCWLTFAATGYFLLAWVQQPERHGPLVACAVATLCATLTRYDGWVLVAVVPPVIAATDLFGLGRPRRGWRAAERDLVLWGVPACLGIVLWLCWSRLLFGQWFYFQRGPYSSQQQTASQLTASFVGSRGHLVTDLGLYALDTAETLGLPVACLAGLGLLLGLWLLLKGKRLPEALVLLTLGAPALFYVAALYTGQASLLNARTLFFPGGVIPPAQGISLFNARFGSEMVAPAAVCAACLVPPVGRHVLRLRRSFASLMERAGRRSVRVGLPLVILLSSAWLAHGGVITVMSNDNPPFCAGNWTVAAYLQQHDDGRGSILMTLSPFRLSVAESGLPFARVVWEGSAPLWGEALARPAASGVEWIVMQPGDTVARTMAREPRSFARDFRLVATNPYSGLQLYHASAIPLAPPHPLSSYLAGERMFCSIDSYQPPYDGGS